MNVLHVYRTYFPDTQGGLEEVIHQITRNVVPHGVTSRIFTLSPDPSPAVVEWDGCKVQRYPRSLEIASCGISFSAMAGFRDAVAWADLVHYHFPWPFADLLHFLAPVRKPTVMSYHSDIVRQQGLLRLYRPLMRRFLNDMDVIVPTSPNYVASSEELGRYRAKIEIIPIGLDEQSYPGVENRELQEARQQFGKDFFLFIGVLRYYKGLHILIEAARLSGLPCIIVGRGPMEQELKQQVQEGHMDNVRFLSYVDDKTKMALLRLCRAVVFPSHLRSEAFGVTLLEGAMSGKPLVSTEIGTGTSYVNLDGETGMVIPPGDPRRLADAMQKLSGDPALCQRFGNAARQRYEQMFTGQQMGTQYFRLYQRLVSA